MEFCQPALRKSERIKVPKIFEWRSREVSPKLNRYDHSLFEARSSMSESCAYRFEPLLVNLSERWDYLNAFEWSIRRVWVENIAVCLLCAHMPSLWLKCR